MKARISSAAASSIEVVNRRVNNIGTSESTIVRQGTDRILIQFPGLQGTTELKELLGKIAKLTFHDVHPSITAEDAKLTTVPLGYKIYPGDKAEGGEFLLEEDACRPRRRPGRCAAGLRLPHQRGGDQFPLQSVGRPQVRCFHQRQRRPAVCDIAR